MVEVLCLIVNKYTIENYQKKLLVEVLYKMEEMYFLNVDLHIMLIKNRVFTISEWEEQTAIFVKNSPGNLQEQEFKFLSEIINKSVFKEKFISQKQIPHLMNLLEETDNSSPNDSQTITARNTLK